MSIVTYERGCDNELVEVVIQVEESRSTGVALTAHVSLCMAVILYNHLHLLIIDARPVLALKL